MPRVVVKQQTNTCPRVINAQWIDSNLIAVLQWMAMLRVVANRQTYLILQATSTQQTNSGLIAVLQQTAMPRVSARPQADISRNQPLSKASATNRQKSINSQHVTDRLWSDGCVTT